MEPQYLELGEFTKNIATVVRTCASGSSADELLTAFKKFDDWFCTSTVKQTQRVVDALRKFRVAVNIGEKAKVEFDEYRVG